MTEADLPPARRAPARRLIVNADDLGRTAGINAGIFEAARSGILTSATLMVNYPAAVDAGRALRGSDAPSIGVGLHVALTGGPLALSAAEVPSLVEGSGGAPAKPEGHHDLVFEEVVAEVRAQLRRFRDLVDRDPTHFDSHHHAHRLPVVLDAVGTVALEAGRPVRNAGPEVKRHLESRGVRTTDHFEERFFGAGATREKLLAILRGLPAGSTELMCHPARVDDELRSSSGYAEPRRHELAALTDPAILDAIGELDIVLVDFAELAAR